MKTSQNEKLANNIKNDNRRNGYGERKMEIVDEFARQGEDYWATEIPKNRLDQIQKLYPDTWEEYISRY